MNPGGFWAPDGLPDQNIQMTEVGCFRHHKKVFSHQEFHLSHLAQAEDQQSVRLQIVTYVIQVQVVLLMILTDRSDPSSSLDGCAPGKYKGWVKIHGLLGPGPSTGGKEFFKKKRGLRVFQTFLSRSLKKYMAYTFLVTLAHLSIFYRKKRGKILFS